MDEKTKNAIALKKFSIIGPVLNGQVSNNVEYFRKVASSPIEMPYYGMRNYSYKTLESWLYDYNKCGLEGLVRGTRSDKGKSRKISYELGKEIIARRKANPGLPITLLYEQMMSDGLIDPLSVSRPTVYRYIEDLSLAGEFKSDTENPESLRFSHEHVGDLWQGDVLYGPYITEGKRKIQTYLHMFIDDASRYPTYSQFYLSQNFETLRHCFKEAVLRRGIPRLVYTDNAKIYRSQQFEYICASLGCTLLHSQPFVPQGRGKIERMFRTVRMRFLSTLDRVVLKDLDDLNQRYFKWLEDDYKKKSHKGLNGLSPHDVFMSQVSKLKLVTNIERISEDFLLRITRKIQPDATTQIENVLYETDSRFSGKRVEIRYEPEWLN
ncbi:MAG TPA: DDE-type integrase/transposase/recombinase, partial [Sedimentibacter sp.]|nr:DDE-type integrase/transposase/recombinase [Sedimentibacter sp.]